MNKFLVLFLSLGLITPANAEDVATDTIKEVTTLEESALQKEEINAVSEKKPEAEIVYKIENQVIPLPQCNDERLYQKNVEFIRSYFDTVSDRSTLQRRRRYFILKNLDRFEQENVANYQTAETSPISDYIADVKVNNGLTDDNLRLCKNISKDNFAKELYLLIYPEQEGYRVRIINLMPKMERYENISFEYK